MTTSIRYSGIVHCCGEPDAGKTRMMLETVPLAKIALFHDDTKVPPLVDKLGLFVNIPQKTKELKMMEKGQWVIEQINGIKTGQFDAIIFDTWADTEQALRYWGKAHAHQFRESSTFSAMGKMKNGEEWKEGDRYVERVINDLATKAKFIGLITHLKEQNIAGAKTGKMIPEGGNILNTVCNFRVWLRKNPDSGVPIALVLKRLAEDTVNKQGFLETVNIMPWKLTPQNEHKSVWDVIDWYRQNPFGNRSPEAYETPDAFEMSILTGIMTPEQQVIWRANLKEKELQERDEVELFSQEEKDIKTFVLEQNGKPLPALKVALENEAKERGWSRLEFDLGYITQLIG